MKSLVRHGWRDATIQELCRLPIGDLRQWFLDLPLTGHSEATGHQAVTEILHRLRSLEELGLAYLTLETAGPFPRRR